MTVDPFASTVPVAETPDYMRDAFAEYREKRDRQTFGAQSFRPSLAANAATTIIPVTQRESRFYSAADLASRPVPPREWLVHDLVPRKTVTLFAGDGGTGKSLLALQLAIGAATGTGWLGRSVEQGRVIFLTAEDDEDELHRRTDDILRAGGLSYADLSGLTLRSLAGEDALLAVETQVALIQSTLFEELDARAEAEAPVLIVIDTLADVYPANENDRAKVRQFVGILRGLALKRRCAVLLLGHPSLTGLNSGSGMSGSTAWSNSVRSRLYLSRIAPDGHEPDPDKRILATKKANYGRIGGEIAMTWKAGVFVADGTPASLDRMATGAKAERVFMRLLADVTAQGRRVNAAGGPNYAPKIFAAHPKCEGITVRAFRAAMEALLSRCEIRVSLDGPPSRRVSFLQIGGNQ
jgi:RecA-family ATPase